MTPRGVASVATSSRPQEIAPMHENVGLRTLQIAGVEPARTTTLPGSSEICGRKLLFEVCGSKSLPSRVWSLRPFTCSTSASSVADGPVRAAHPSQRAVLPAASRAAGRMPHVAQRAPAGWSARMLRQPPSLIPSPPASPVTSLTKAEQYSIQSSCLHLTVYTLDRGWVGIRDQVEYRADFI